MSPEQKIKYILHCVFAIVERNGGLMIIDNISEFGDRVIHVGVRPHLEDDFIILTTDSDER